MSGRGTRASAFVLLALWALPWTPVGAQVDSARADSARADSAAQVDYTAQFLEASERQHEVVPGMARLLPGSPLPPLSRQVFTRDSMEWSGAGTLADLLAQVPGVFVWRGGWLMQPEMASYRGRGATSVEYVLDGMPFLPLGPDSVGVDPAQIVLGMLDRVDVERWPDKLRVLMYTRNHQRLAPASRLAIGTGDQSVARYQATFEKRWQSGLGMGIGGDFLNFPTGTLRSGDRLQTQFWGQVNYVPSSRVGLQYQFFQTDIDRDPIRQSIGDTLTPPLDGRRTDQQLRFFFKRRPDPTGLRADVLVGQSQWKGSGVNQSTYNYLARLGSRQATSYWLAEAGGSSLWTPVALRAEAGWVPARRVSASLEGVYRRYVGERSDGWVGVRAGLGLPLGLLLSASGRYGQEVVAPSIPTDQAQTVAAGDVTLSLRRETVELSGSLSRTPAFTPAPFQPYRVVAQLRPADATEWASMTGRIRPVRWLTVEGWYSHALGTPPDGQPGSQAWARVAFRSKFLRKFPSGAFDLKLQLTLEAWGEGTLGIDSTGATVDLPAAQVWVSFVQLEIGRFRAYYEVRNLLGNDTEYVPGYQLPFVGSYFGVRWDFLN